MHLYDRIKCDDNELFEDNIYLFTNWFKFNLIHAGYNHFFDIETHLSLAKKIEFQLETNRDKSLSYIFSYLKNDLFGDSDILFSKYDLCIDLLDVVRDIHNGTYKNGGQIRGIVMGECFRGEIDDLVNELERDYLNDLLENLRELLVGEDLGTEKFDELKYSTKLIVSHFLLKGYSRLDLEESFLIAANFVPKIGVENEHSQIEIQSIDEIINYFHDLENATERPFTFYIPINGVEFNENETLQYNNVDFFHASNNEITNLLSKTNEKYSNWLVDVSDGRVFCKTIISAMSLSSAKEYAFSSFKSELTYLNISLNTDGKLNGEFFIGTEDGEEFTNYFKSPVREVGHFDIETFKNNPFELYRRSDTDAKARIRRFEPLFISSISESSYEREISSLWHYLEVMFYHWKKQSKLQELISYLLLLDENRHCLKQDISNFIFDLLEHERDWVLGVNYETQEELKVMESLVIERLRTEIENPFIQKLIDMYEEFDLQDNLEKSQEFYLSTMVEFFSIRNSFLHSGEVNNLSIIKLKNIVPFLISRVRNLLHSVIERENSFNNIVTNLYTTSKGLI